MTVYQPLHPQENGLTSMETAFQRELMITFAGSSSSLLSPAICTICVYCCTKHVRDHSNNSKLYARLKEMKHDETLHDTYQSAARAMGLISGQEEYFLCMQEAAVFQVGHQLRGLLVT